MLLSIMSFKDQGHPIYNMIWINKRTNRIITPSTPDAFTETGMFRWPNCTKQEEFPTWRLLPLAVERRGPAASWKPVVLVLSEAFAFTNIEMHVV